jgi:hypothetical protein
MQEVVWSEPHIAGPREGWVEWNLAALERRACPLEEIPRNDEKTSVSKIPR